MEHFAEESVVAGKYRLVRQLGQGGMGAVWLAEHLSLHSQVAVKLLHGDMANSSEALSRFLREAQSAASLRSPHVVQILDHGVDAGTPYIAMELLDGESLASRLERVTSMSREEVARIMTHIGRAMGRAHEAGIVHRDLKPDNVFLVHNDDEEIAKVLDFGIAKSNVRGSLEGSASSATRTGAILGTPYYMSPEQVEGAKSLDHRADIWAMGVIAFECLLGRRPFEAETLGSLLLAICTRPIPVPSQCGAVPVGVDAWFARACDREPSARFTTARDAALELKRVCEGAASGQPSDGLSLGPAESSLPAAPVPREAAAPALSNHSVAAFSASQLEVVRAGKKASFAPKLAAAVLIPALGSGVAVWAHFASQPAPAASASGTTVSSANVSAKQVALDAARSISPAPPAASEAPAHPVVAPAPVALALSAGMSALAAPARVSAKRALTPVAAHSAEPATSSIASKPLKPTQPAVESRHLNNSVRSDKGSSRAGFCSVRGRADELRRTKPSQT